MLYSRKDSYGSCYDTIFAGKGIRRCWNAVYAWGILSYKANVNVTYIYFRAYISFDYPMP